MARYRGILQGQRGEVSKLGSPSSGLQTRANGWNTGALVIIRPDPDDPTLDRIQVYRTGGSNGARTAGYVASWTEGKETEGHPTA